MQITDKYDLLQYLVDNMDSQNSYIDRDRKVSQLINPYDLSQYLTELKRDGFIEVYLGGQFHIYNKAVNFLAERKTAQSKFTVVKRTSSGVIRWMFGLAGSLIVALLAAYLVWRFGWK